MREKLTSQSNTELLKTSKIMATNYADWTNDTERMIEFTEKAPAHVAGKRLPILSAAGFPNFAIKFNYKIDTETLDVISPADPEYKTSKLPTVNDLVDAGIVREWFPFKHIELKAAHKMLLADGSLDVDGIIRWFKDRGFIVSKKAILHNYEAWQYDCKSGYRDEKSGIHVFSPCGCNPFDLCVTELNDMCIHWQKTYMC